MGTAANLSGPGSSGECFPRHRPPRKDGLCPLGIPFPQIRGAASVGWVFLAPDGGIGRDRSLSLCPLFWRLGWLGTLRRENSLTVRSAGCRVPGEGWPGALSSCSWKEGLGFSEPGWGAAARLPGGKGAGPASQPAVPDSFLSRAGGPRDRSPVCGLGGERPKREGEQEGHSGALWPSWGWGEKQSTKSFFVKWILRAPGHTVQQAGSPWRGGVGLGMR